MIVDLARLFRGPTGPLAAELLALVPSPAAVHDASGRHLAGDAGAQGTSHPILRGETVVGAVIGPAEAGVLARWLTNALEREQERRALADETLARYKELS